jgi:hypothetical protein
VICREAAPVVLVLVVVLVIEKVLRYGVNFADGFQEGLLSRRDRMIIARQFTAWNVSKKGTVP